MDSTPLALAELLAEEMSRLWRCGQPRRVEDFLHRHPALADSPDAVLELLAEEISLRQGAGNEPDTHELEQRFPAWPGQVRALLACARVLHTRPAEPVFPEVGMALGEFELLTELGRGGHARVFLARQLTLAGRLVVLKVGPRTGQEHLSLARLQHSHIVPLYSAHEFPGQGLRGLCLPYFGGATLADLLREMSGTAPAQRTGADLVAALSRISDCRFQIADWKRGADGSVLSSNLQSEICNLKSEVGGPACRFLARVSYVRAVCWLGACLADALQYAQERGLVHLDLKPSNVLLAADGQPMLLDFHLARGALPAGALAPAWLGGTPGYMAPEQEAALRAVAEGRPLETAVDGRADLYALGRLLCDLLGFSSLGTRDEGRGTRDEDRLDSSLVPRPSSLRRFRGGCPTCWIAAWRRTRPGATVMPNRWQPTCAATSAASPCGGSRRWPGRTLQAPAPAVCTAAFVAVPGDPCWQRRTGGRGPAPRRIGPHRSARWTGVSGARPLRRGPRPLPRRPGPDRGTALVRRAAATTGPRRFPGGTRSSNRRAAPLL